MQTNNSTQSLLSENLQKHTSNTKIETQNIQTTKSDLLSIHMQSEHLSQKSQTSNETSSDMHSKNKLPIIDATNVILRRKRKRAWLKRRKERLKIEKIKALLIRKEKDKKIDQNLALEREKEEKMQKNRLLASEAQEALAEITEKINDAESYISYLKSRTFCKETVNVPCKVDDTQCTPIENEKELNIWQQTLENYKSEERKLRKQINAARSSPEFHWCHALFGCSSFTDGSSENTFEKFVELRRAWDSYIVPTDTNFGSQIPLGWVMPNTDPMPSWSIYRN